MYIGNHGNIIAQVMRRQTMYTFREVFVSALTNGLYPKWFNKVYTSCVNIIIMFTNNRSREILKSLYSVKISLSSTYPDEEP